MKNLALMKTLIFNGFLENVDLNMLSFDETRQCFYFIEHALKCNGLYISAVKPERATEKKPIQHKTLRQRLFQQIQY